VPGGARRLKRAAAHVLVVDDEPDIRELLELTLVRMGLDVASVGTIAEAKERLKQERFDLCLTDMRLEDGEGLDLVRHISGHAADVPVAVITAYGSAENAVAALKAGAFDYVSKPVGLEQLRALVRAALSLPDRGEAPARDKRLHGRLLGESAPLAQVREMIAKLARTQAPVYISGESGTGKELAARLIHENGARRERPFIPVNCGAIPENLMESEFFGYKKGAFTGAEGDRDGFFQAANGGTLFLDEISEIPVALQVKFLRAIQEKEVTPLGSSQPVKVDLRIIAASNRNLAEEVKKGTFREDLFYRLSVVPIHLPPLRERREDIPLLIEHFIAAFSQEYNVEPRRIALDALEKIVAYPWPGNIRELQNVIERVFALTQSNEITLEDLPSAVSGFEEQPINFQELSELPTLEEMERSLITAALRKSHGNKNEAARLLAIDRQRLYRKIEKYGFDPPVRGPEREVALGVVSSAIPS